MNLVITKIFASSLALRYIEVPLYLILFVYFSKSWGGGPWPPPAPLPARALKNAEEERKLIENGT